MVVTGAGILPYTIKNNKLYFLLGENYGKGWKDFGGMCEKNEFILTTAKREFMEESLSSILTKHELNCRILSHYDSIVINKNEYYRVYFLYIKPNQFNKKLFFKNRSITTSKHEKEITTIKWFSCKQLSTFTNFRYSNYIKFFKTICKV
jgi:hypothetical protein